MSIPQALYEQAGPLVLAAMVTAWAVLRMYQADAPVGRALDRLLRATAASSDEHDDDRDRWAAERARLQTRADVAEEQAASERAARLLTLSVATELHAVARVWRVRALSAKWTPNGSPDTVPDLDEVYGRLPHAG